MDVPLLKASSFLPCACLCPLSSWTFEAAHSSLLRTFGFFSDISLKFIPPINIWNICIDLRLFSKLLVEPFLRPLRSKDVRCWILNIEVTTLKICNHFWKFGCQPRKNKAVLCRTNGCKVVIYLSFLLFLFVLVSNAKRKISMSNKSELCNCLSYRGLSYFSKVGSQTLRNDYKISRL